MKKSAHALESGGFTRRRVTCRLNQGSGSALLGDERDGDGDGDGDDAHDGGNT